MARSFAGGTDKILRASSPITAYPFTLFGRIKITNLAVDTHNVLKISVGGGTDGFIIQVQADGTARAVVIGSGTSVSAVTANTISADGAWHSIVGVFASGSSRSIQLDNGTIASNATAKSVAQTTQTEIGYRGSAGDQNNGHDVCDLALWHGANLITDELTALHNGASPLLIRPEVLAIYVPAVRDVVDVIGGGVWTVTGTTAADHAPVRVPVRLYLAPKATVGGGATAPFPPWPQFDRVMGTPMRM